MAGTPGDFAYTAGAVGLALGTLRIIEGLVSKLRNSNGAADRVLEVQEAKQQQRILTTLESIDDKLDDIKTNTSRWARCPLSDQQGDSYRGKL